MSKRPREPICTVETFAHHPSLMKRDLNPLYRSCFCLAVVTKFSSKRIVSSNSYYRKTDRQTDRQTERQTDRQTDRQTGRQTDRQADIETNSQNVAPQP